MANNLSASSAALWSKVSQYNLLKTSIFRSICSFAEQAGLKMGVSVDRPYDSVIATQKYAKGVPATAQDISSTSDKLEINDSSEALIYIDNVDLAQNNINMATKKALEMGRAMKVDIDAAALYAGARGAVSSVDASDFGGTAGVGVTLSTSNVVAVVSRIKLKLIRQNVSIEPGNLFIAASGELQQVIIEFLAGKESALGDKRTEDGMVGTFLGFELFDTNNAPASIRWTPANTPSDADAITVNGVTFTAETGALDAAGKFKSETSVEVTLAHLAAFINAGGATVTASGYALSVADQRIVQRWVAVPAATYIDIYCKGASYITATGTEAADLFSRPTQHIVAGVKKAIDSVVQIEPDIEITSALSNGLHGKYYGGLTVFGHKVFNEGTKKLVDVKLDTTSF
jgi:hypothetical protein